MKLKNIIIVLIYLVLCNLCSFAQSKLSNINGYLETTSYSYAYMYMSERNLIIKKPIINKKFSFQINKDKDFEMAILYFGIDSSRTYTDVIANRNKGIFESKTIVLDDTISIYVKDNVRESQVIGGNDTKALFAMDEAIKTGDFKTFFINYKQSPIALMLLKVMLSVEKNTKYKLSIDFNKIYESLPLILQNSKKGKEVKALIDELLVKQDH